MIFPALYSGQCDCGHFNIFRHPRRHDWLLKKCEKCARDMRMAQVALRVITAETVEGVRILNGE